MNVLLRRKGFGLSTLRSLLPLMTTNPIIRNHVSIRTVRPVPNTMAISWGYVNTCPIEIRQLNEPNATGLVSNKSLFRQKLMNAGLAMATTTSRSQVIEWYNLGQKFIVRPKNHYGGRNLYLVSNIDELDNAIRNCGQGWYASKYISKVAEYRLFVAQGRVVWYAEKRVEDTTAIAWNHEQGGVFNNVRFGSWDLEVVKFSLKAMELSGLDFGAVDVIVDNENIPYVLEINTAPSIESEYRLEKTAKVFDYMFANPDANFKDFYNYRGDEIHPNNWRYFIHPVSSIEAKGIDELDEMASVVPEEPFTPHWYKVNKNTHYEVYWKESRHEVPSSPKMKYYPETKHVVVPAKMTLEKFSECLAFIQGEVL